MKSEKGFTLVELLVVIAIIGILMAVLVPTLIGGRDRAMDTKARGFIANIESAIERYRIDNGIYPDSEVSSPWSTTILVSEITKKTSSSKPYMTFKDEELTADKEIKNPAVAGDVLKYRNNKMEDLADDSEAPVKNKERVDIWCKDYSGKKAGINNWE